ncbi:hypothetical protein NP233_g10949 [Leucocoprinus birnbaumii]|uniref:Conserved oligomeric Golgi complex subunit 1 n=1 Tax=Leucocoprinus birnbaumii TaxID=56174 RepID=A0AAD5VI97_9AGAR|nr:hypothetical protein NP233_g10949 [Leucocoprinus birnbaumii]
MFRRPSAAQSTSSTVGNGYPLTKAPSAMSASGSSAQTPSTKRSASNTTTILSKEDQEFKTDELFAKHTISEINVIHGRLRTDADIKKEELRQMVGERYRDLLQASSSIISIAQSSKRVVDALDDSRNAIKSQTDPPLPRTSSVASVQDRHLHALQVLAAHMKLLLDAPEHLWRLIERKKFFPAAWLFLLARVIHRALVRSDEQDDEAWKSQGVDVLAEFPLIQRQWDVVSQFRSQIIHKATLWLRDASSSVEDACATLVTLHLLDSRPLHDTLSSLFLQRTKTLNAALATKSTSGPSSLSPSISRQPANGKIAFSFSQDTSTSSLAKPRIREVKESLYNALTILSQTVHVARGVFGGTSGHALIENVLEFIQSDANRNPSIPTELHLTTQALLTNVTSAAHFQLLPQSLQSYKPYVDLTSSSISLRQDQFLAQLNEWFIQSNKSLEGAAVRWFKELETVKEVWSVRLASRKWISATTLAEQEKARLSAMFDEICRARIVEIWTSMLKGASAAFETTLDVSLRTIASDEEDYNNSSFDFLFNPVALPAVAQSSTSYDIPLRKYQKSLKQQLLGRTVLLDSVLDTLERCAKLVHEEICMIRAGSSNESKSMVSSLTQQHEPAAEELTRSSVHILQKAVGQIDGDDDKSNRKLGFLSQITEELASRSTFIDQVGSDQAAREAFVHQLQALNKSILATWRRRTIAGILHRSRFSLRVIPTSIAGPTPELLQALVALYGALQELSFKWDNSLQTSFMQDTLQLFIEMWLGEGDGRENATGHDLALLQELTNTVELQAKSSGALKDFQNKLRQMADGSEFKACASEHIKRMQTFLPATVECRSSQGRPQAEGSDKFPNLLRYGPPPPEMQTPSDFAKPGPRFGLLLVAGEN